jgi:hypothetical protein
MAKLSSIKPNPSNPRIIKDERFERLKQSITDFPQMMELRPMIVDESNTLLGGNMRFKALQDLGYKEIPDTWIKKASELTEEQKKEFIIKDNVGFGEWEWEQLANEWDVEQLTGWGLDIPQFHGIENGTDGFTLPDGDKAPFQQMTFTLADEQAIQIQNAISDIKQTDEYKFAETMGNENSNGNALYLIIMQWAEQRI